MTQHFNLRFDSVETGEFDSTHGAQSDEQRRLAYAMSQPANAAMQAYQGKIEEALRQPGGTVVVICEGPFVNPGGATVICDCGLCGKRALFYCMDQVSVETLRKGKGVCADCSMLPRWMLN